MKKSPMIMSDLLAYVLSLDDAMLRVFKIVEAVQKEAADTLSDEFQIASEIWGVFEKFAARHTTDNCQSAKDSPGAPSFTYRDI